MGRARLSVTALAIAVVAVWAGPANAGSQIQLGQLAPGNPEIGCTDGNAVQAAVVSGQPSYTVPSDGAITSWSHRGRDIDPGSGRLQIWRPAGGTSYTLVGRSVLRAFVAGENNNFATNIPVSAGDVLGLRTAAPGGGCGFFSDVTRMRDVADLETNATDPAPGETRDLSITASIMRVNVSATFDPTDPAPPPIVTPTVDSSATKGKQSAGNLKIKLTPDQDSTLELDGNANVAKPKRVLASAAAKKFKPKVKKKTGVQLQAGVEKTIPVKFKKNNKTLKRIKKLQKRSKKARQGSKVILNLTLTTTTGVVSDTKLKIKLKP